VAKIVTASSPPCREEDRDEEQADDCYGHALHRTFVSRLVLDSVSAVLSYVLSGASRGSGFPQPGNSRLRPRWIWAPPYQHGSAPEEQEGIAPA
jgi:hypothetical protein